MTKKKEVKGYVSFMVEPSILKAFDEAVLRDIKFENRSATIRFLMKKLIGGEV